MKLLAKFALFVFLAIAGQVGPALADHYLCAPNPVANPASRSIQGPSGKFYTLNGSGCAFIPNTTDIAAFQSQGFTDLTIYFVTAGPNSTITSLTGLTTPLPYNEGGTGTATGFALGNVAVGAANSGLQDSGNQLIKVGHDIRDPTNTDDTTQGYVVGSMWINTTPVTPSIWVAKSVTANAASWGKAIASLPFGSTTMGWVFNPTFLGPINYFTAPSTTGPNQNTEALTSIAGTLSRLHVKVTTPPGTGHQYIFTVYVGAPAALIATPITCTISDTNSTCDSSPIQTAAIAEAQAYSVFCDLVGGTALAAQSAMSLMLSY